ncbi:hypothetical protein PGT21_005378 [Puccinia graminis f. sp. tritici]|uniref:Uncharacterized protein n=1 Tax=Puccinia graminis f. sp. tritici TaxID=56615 RepID=A0A5B0MC73_PUCGR|nr:hypothetical protein PGT21_005378 [Puccinia graminis f. sp. tritici]
MSERHSRTSDSSRFDSPNTVTKNLLVMLHPLAKEFEERFMNSVPVKYRESYCVLLRK